MNCDQTKSWFFIQRRAVRAAGGEDPVLRSVLDKYDLKVAEQDAERSPRSELEPEPESEPETDSKHSSDSLSGLNSGSSQILAYSSVLFFCMILAF